MPSERTVGVNAMRLCRAILYLNLGVVGLSGAWLCLLYEETRRDTERFPTAAHFTEVRVTDGATLRVEDGELRMVEGKGLSYGTGFGPHGWTVALLVTTAGALMVSTGTVWVLSRQVGTCCGCGRFGREPAEYVADRAR